MLAFLIGLLVLMIAALALVAAVRTRRQSMRREQEDEL
jgi:hypothetical protein